MGRVFLSYARPDAAIAQRLAEALGEHGHQVWWDRHIEGGSRFVSEIDRELKEAQAVVVLWSAHSCDSAWVQDEAAEGRESGRLVPVLVDSTRPPLGFRQFHAIDLSNWNGIGLPENLPALLSAIGKFDGGTGGEPAEAAREPISTGEASASICVLPFANMSGEPEQEYFSDGISEDIITDLSKVSALSVVARNTAFTFKGTAVDVPALARRLGVSHVLEGSVRKSGGRVRITAQLIDGASGNHIWAERYDRDLTDVFAIQDEISQAIVGALKVRLLPSEKQAIEARGTESAEAYDLYLLARQYWITGNHGDRRREERVIRICRKAIEIDPDYARAWALMAIAQSNLWYSFSSGDDDGKPAAERALALDAGIAEAHCPIARNAAEQGRIDDADVEIARALELDPDSWEANKEAARIMMRQRRLPEATARFEKAANLMPTDFHAWGMLCTCYKALGRAEDRRVAAERALEEVERVLKEDPNNGAALSFGVGSLVILGQPDRAKQWMQRAMLVDPDNINMRYNFACTLATDLADKEAALSALAEIFPRMGPTTVKLGDTDPDFDCIRDDPRFQAMVRDARKRLGMGT